MNFEKGLLPAAFALFVLTGSALADDVSVTVKRGDTLQTISKEYFGTTRRWGDILSWNKAEVPDPSNLTIGVQLKIHDPKNAVAAVAQGETYSATESGSDSDVPDFDASEVEPQAVVVPKAVASQVRNPATVVAGSTIHAYRDFEF